jgi:hypothetical protein
VPHSLKGQSVSDTGRLGQCAALTKGTECERYWEARTVCRINLRDRV